ncbi:hypothetical protein NZK35_11250 [Stieleria sp. ICT_E10.1]|uniref:hypothetical protein n=1 Tax=Stieleria sedimenti TaxID=2976331 RepID=UPI00217F4C51|nr:hypothetical protein [Stieleria sedimenti]MCS7467219.1 hypothetical protein [Stieleria sedimenti]
MQSLETLPRFTILIHTVGQGFARRQPSAGRGIAAGPVHWDWLFQPPGDRSGGPADDSRADHLKKTTPIAGLWTWATDPLPELDKPPSDRVDRITTPALRLADHRERYLDFEGDIGAGRGLVRQLATGRYELKRQTAACFEARLRWTRSTTEGSTTGMRQGRDADAWMVIRFSQSDGDAAEQNQTWTATLFSERDT